MPILKKNSYKECWKHNRNTIKEIQYLEHHQNRLIEVVANIKIVEALTKIFSRPNSNSLLKALIPEYRLFNHD